MAEVLETYSFMTDTPDFWRREYQFYPQHGGRFTGEPAYFKHIMGAARASWTRPGMKPADFHYAVFHQPNGKFPLRAGEMLGFTQEADRAGLARPQARQHLLRALAAGADGDPRHRQAGRPDPDGLVRLGRGQRRLRLARHRAHRRGPGPGPTDADAARQRTRSTSSTASTPSSAARSGRRSRRRR